MTPSEFDDHVASRHDVAATVADLLDYRYRYLDHGGTDLKFANISHAYVFRFNNKEKGSAISGSTIRGRWKEQKQSAVFVYVSEKTNFNVFPRRVGVKQFLDRLTQDVTNHLGLKAYFGTCAYVAESFGPDEQDILIDCFPPSSELTRIRLETDPLPLVDGQIDKLANYKADSQAFKDN